MPNTNTQVTGPIWCRNTDVHTHTHTYSHTYSRTHTHTHLCAEALTQDTQTYTAGCQYIQCVYSNVCVCVCVQLLKHSGLDQQAYRVTLMRVEWGLAGLESWILNHWSHPLHNSGSGLSGSNTKQWDRDSPKAFLSVCLSVTHTHKHIHTHLVFFFADGLIQSVHTHTYPHTHTHINTIDQYPRCSVSTVQQCQPQPFTQTRPQTLFQSRQTTPPHVSKE